MTSGFSNTPPSTVPSDPESLTSDLHRPLRKKVSKENTCSPMASSCRLLYVDALAGHEIGEFHAMIDQRRTKLIIDVHAVAAAGCRTRRTFHHPLHARPIRCTPSKVYDYGLGSCARRVSVIFVDCAAAKKLFRWSTTNFTPVMRRYTGRRPGLLLVRSVASKPLEFTFK